MRLPDGPFRSSQVALNAVGRIAEVQLGKMLQPAASSTQDIEVPYLRAGHLSHLPEELPRMWASPKDTAQYRVEAGDILVAEGGDVGRVGFVPESVAGALIQNSLHRVRPKGGRDRRFLAYVLEAVYLGDWLEVLCNKSTFGHLTVEKLTALRVPDPPLALQRAIADYLDTETARIDALITKKQRMIELSTLRWRRQLLDVAAPHLGGAPVPEGWVPGRLRNLVDRVVGGSWGAEPGETAVDAPCVRAADFNFPRLSAEGGALRSYGLSEMQSRVVHPGDLVIEKSGGGDEAPVGRVVMWLGEGNAVPTNFAARLRPTEAHDPWFVLLAFRAAYEAGLNWRSIKQTTGIQNLDTGAYLSEPWPIPPLDVQQRVASNLRAMLGSTMTLRDVLEKQIDLLREHRQALITAAVTGEIDIPGVAA